MSIGLAVKNKKNISADSWNAIYESEVVRRIRERYSLDQELAILRQRDSKPKEFLEYNAYVEKCKAEIKAEMEA